MEPEGPYAWWRAALAEPHKIGNALPIHESAPQCGYYRKRNKGRPDTPAAIWLEGEKLCATDDRSLVDPSTIWTWIAKHPISYETYLEVYASGRWPDEAPPAVVTAKAPPAGIGHNLPEDPAERARLELEAEREAVNTFLKQPIADELRAAQAADMKTRIGDLKKRLLAMYEKANRPLLEQQEILRRELKRPADEAEALVKRLTGAGADYLRAEKRKEEQRQAAARAEADRIRQEAAEAAARLAAAARELEAAPVDVPLDADTIRQQEEAEAEAKRLAAELAAAEREAAARKVSVGQTGAKMGLFTVTYAEITDPEKLLMALKDEPDIRKEMENLANRSAKAGVELPGMKIRTREDAR